MATAKDTDKKQELSAEVESTALTTMDGFFESAGDTGLEDFAQSDFTVPYIGVLQALSKPLQKNHSKFVKGAEQGMFINSATQKLIDGDTGFIFVPFFFTHSYKAWRPNNGGIAHDYGSNPEIYESLPVTDDFKRLDPEGNEVIDSTDYYGFIIDEENQVFDPAVVPLAKIHAKKAKRWNNLIRAHVEKHPKTGAAVRLPIWAYAYHLTTGPESNEKGSWFSHIIADYKKLSEMGDFGLSIFKAAKEMRDNVTSGKIKAASEEPDSVVSSGDGDGAF